jgi:hypothetical protein
MFPSVTDFPVSFLFSVFIPSDSFFIPGVPYISSGYTGRVSTYQEE